MVPSARLELALQKGTDFKSVVSTNFTTRALINFMNIYANIYNSTTPQPLSKSPSSYLHDTRYRIQSL